MIIRYLYVGNPETNEMASEKIVAKDMLDLELKVEDRVWHLGFHIRVYCPVWALYNPKNMPDRKDMIEDFIKYLDHCRKKTLA